MSTGKGSSEHSITKSTDLAARIGAIGVLLSSVGSSAPLENLTMPQAVLLGALVLSSALTCAAYTISRGLAKTEVRVPK